MELNLLKGLAEQINKIDVNKFIEEISERLKIMEQELVIDRFEGNFAVCEDRKTGKICEIEMDKLPNNAKEGSVLKYEKGKYEIDIQKENEISQRIKDKMDDLWN